MYDYRRGESILGAFLLGGIVGAVLGLLFSPRSGRENREFIAAKADEYWGEGKQFYETSRSKVLDETEEMRVKIDAARERLKEQVDTVTQQAKGKIQEDAVHKAGESMRTGLETVEDKAQAALDKLADKTAPAGADEAVAATDLPVVE
jgi:gas vesicle protein